MDDLLPATLYDFTVCAFMVAGGTLIIFVANPWVVIRSGLGGRVAEMLQLDILTRTQDSVQLGGRMGVSMPQFHV